MSSFPPLDVLFPLLQCPKCDPPALLSAPVTNYAGHTVCHAHVDDFCDPADNPNASFSPNLVPPLLPPASQVAFFTSPPASALPTQTTSMVDVIVNKIIGLATRSRNRLQLELEDNALHESQQSCRTSRQGNREAEVLADFRKELLSELTCEICLSLLYQPITTPCQHTFCSECLQRTLDHSTSCPLCRREFPGYAYFQQHAYNRVILSILQTFFPDQYTEQIESAAADERDKFDTPIFVCQLSLPGLPTLLQIFEPRYRLMLRRCLDSPQPRFGMIMPPAESTVYGTMLEIRKVEMLPDGRSMVETWGTSRFRILERGYRDGYMVARVEHFDDIPPERESVLRPPPSPTDEELMNMCHQFLTEIRRYNTAPWVTQRMNSTLAYMPVDVANFSFWMALILPIQEREKAKLLTIRSSRSRLLLVVRWIEQLRECWWYPSGCIVS